MVGVLLCESCCGHLKNFTSFAAASLLHVFGQSLIFNHVAYELGRYGLPLSNKGEGSVNCSFLHLYVFSACVTVNMSLMN